jgi:DNA replication protein DnaC
MLTNPTQEKLRALRLFGMLKALETQNEVPDVDKLSFTERFGLIVDTEYTERQNKALSKRLGSAKLKQQACLEDIDFKAARNLDKRLITQLASCHWVQEALNILITGKTGTGKTYVACALANKACRAGFTSLYIRAPRLFHEITVTKVNNTYTRFLARLAKIDVLLIDDFALIPLSEEHCRDMLEITDDRCNKKSTIIISQLPVNTWHQTMANSTLADAILDRVVNNSYRLDLAGPSRRKNPNKEEDSE